MKNRSLLYLLILPFLLLACYYDKEELLYTSTCSSPAHFTEVKTIILSKCSTNGCHNSSAAGGVVLETYDQISSRAGRINQRAIIDRTMPPGAPLTADETRILRCWIQSGAPNN